MLTVVGALVMLVVAESLARAFGIAGAASLVRYRAKVDDPKDASIMLACLSIGLASGVGLFALAGASTVFILAVLWALERAEPWPKKLFELKVTTKDPNGLKAAVEAVLRREKIEHELRGSTEKELLYSAQVHQGKRLDKLTERITQLRQDDIAVAWDEKKPK